MAKFKNINFKAIGEWIIGLSNDPAKLAAFMALSKGERKEKLVGNMEPIGKDWTEITVNFHFDEENIVNVSIPFGPDVLKTVEEITNEVKPIYAFPGFYKSEPPEFPTVPERLEGYTQRLGDYVMSRCK